MYFGPAECVWGSLGCSFGEPSVVFRSIINFGWYCPRLPKRQELSVPYSEHICFQHIHVHLFSVPWRWPGTWSMYFGPAGCVFKLPAFQATQVGGHCDVCSVPVGWTTLKTKSCDLWSCTEPVFMRPAYYRYLKSGHCHVQYMDLKGSLMRAFQ